jgi:hypothetical protein
MGHTMADRSSNEADFLCISCIERGGYGRGCDACRDGEYYFRSSFFGIKGAGV